MIKYLITTFTSSEVSKMVILVRTDIGMGRGKIAAQVAHAAVSLYNFSLETNNPYLKSWFNAGQPKMILKVDTQCMETLTSVYESAKNIGLVTCKIHDAGKTQVDKGTLTTVGIGPSKSEDVDKITRKFKLL